MEGAAKSQKSSMLASTAKAARRGWVFSSKESSAGSMLPFKAATRSLQLCKHTDTEQEQPPALHTGNAAEINLSVTQEVQQCAQH